MKKVIIVFSALRAECGDSFPLSIWHFVCWVFIVMKHILKLLYHKQQ